MDSNRNDKNNNNNNSKATRKPKTKKKAAPMKVVYISNPMKFKICASKFRDLVQELTGQDSELPAADPTNTTTTTLDFDVGNNHHHHQTVPDHAPSGGTSTVEHEDDGEDDHHHAQEVPPTGIIAGPADAAEGGQQQPQKADSPFDSSFDRDDDDVFMPQMLENFPGLMVPSSLLYESAHVDVLRRLDAM